MESELTIGKIRGLLQISDAAGRFNMTAMDHRGSLEKALCPDPQTDCYRVMADFKSDLCSILGPHSSGVLLDPLYGAAQSIAAGMPPRGTGLLVSVEATGYTGETTARVTRLLENWGVEKIKRMGASAVKLLVYFRPDSGELAARQLETIKKVALDCVKFDIPFLVEPVSYALEGETSSDYGRKKTGIVIETAGMMTELPIDVLKAEFPGDMTEPNDDRALLDACRGLDAASKKPWVILSAGADFQVFNRQVELACRAGASGFLGGRAIWQEAVDMDDRETRQRFIQTVSVERLRKLKDLTGAYGRPWWQKLGLKPERLTSVQENWHEKY